LTSYGYYIKDSQFIYKKDPRSSRSATPDPEGYYTCIFTQPPFSMAHHYYGGDVHAESGIWSPSTSTTNFCEEDYAITRYIAEFTSSISNLAYVYLALRHTGWRINRLDQMSVSLLLVGVCSFLYHATLHLTTQLSDEVSMHFLAGALLQRLYTTGQSPGRARCMTVAIYTCIGIMSAIYMRSGNLDVHMAMFVAMLALIGLRTVLLINRRAMSSKEKTKYIRKFGGVCAYLAVAFLLWNIDLQWCYELRSLRNRLGLPWAWLLELHGWWHVLTAVGAALHMELTRDLCP
jgi:dihydroceramidase